MFGVSRQDRDRWNRAAEVVRDTARGLDDHTRECTRRYEATERALDKLAYAISETRTENDRWNRRLMYGLVVVLLTIIGQLLHSRGLW
jgi:hypothetical protein